MKLTGLTKTVFKKILGFTSQPKLIFIDVERLYNDTLLFSSEVRPWAVVCGKYAALELRHAFVEDYLESNGSLDFKTTDYYSFIEKYTREGFTKIYDGNQNYAMVDPDSICKRFARLIDSIVKHIEVYNNLNEHNMIDSMESLFDEIIAFERQNKREVFYIKENRKSQQKENKRYEAPNNILKSIMRNTLVGHLIPSGIINRGRVVVKNGSHRLVIFKVLKDKNIYKNKLPIYILR